MDAFGFTQKDTVIGGISQILKTRENSDGAKVYGLNFEGKIA